MKKVKITLAIVFLCSNLSAQVFENVADILAGGSSYPAELHNQNNRIFFTADDGQNGIELWSTDGSSSGTALVSDLQFGQGSSNPTEFAELGNSLLFSAEVGASGRELWIYDGNVASLLKDINPTGPSNPHDFTLVGNELFFRAFDGVSGFELWTTDGTTAGTQIVKDVYPGFSSGLDRILTVSGSTLYFVGQDSLHGKELWKSDGTDSGTVLVRDMRAGPLGSSITNLIQLDSILLFNANDGVLGNELWKTDGTDSGTQLVKDIHAVNSSSPKFGPILNGKLVFQAKDDSHGTELWCTDGTDSGTVLIKDLDSAITNSDPENFIVAQNKVYFTATDTTHGTEIWVSDGTAAGTRILEDLWPGNVGSYPTELYEYHDHIFFIATPSAFDGPKLFQSDGDLITKIIEPAIAPNASPMDLSGHFETLNDELYFMANFDSRGHELWKYDLTYPTSFEEVDAALGIYLFPNPASDHIYIISENAELLSASIYNMNGQMVVESRSNSQAIDIKILAQGNYIIKVETEKGIFSKQFSKR